MKPAVGWSSRPRRAKELFPANRATRAPGTRSRSSVEPSTSHRGEDSQRVDPAGSSAGAAIVLTPVQSAAPTSPFHRQLPEEIRGVHVTMSLLTLPGKLDEYIGMKSRGLNTLEIDVKDESGNVGFVKGAPAI